MRVGTLYAVLRLNTGAFDAALVNSASRWTKFTAALRAGVFIAAEAFGAILLGSVLAATSFQKHMTESLAIMGDVSAGMRQKLEEAARAVAKTTLFSANEAADAYYYLASAGYTAQQSITLLPIVADFAQAGLIDMAQATELLSDAQTTVGLRSKDAAKNLLGMARTADVLTLAGVESNATMEELAKALTTKAGPALRMVNKDIEEGVAVLMVFANRGVKGAQAGTALAIVMRDLQTKAIKNAAEFQHFGVRVFDAAGKMRDMADIVADLEHALAGMSDRQKKATLIQMGFTDRSVGFLVSLLGTSAQIRQYEKDLRSASGYTHDVAQKQLESFSAGLTIMWHMIQNVAISIGNKLLPGMTDLVHGMAKWFDANEGLIVQLTSGLVGAIGDVARFIMTHLGPAFAFVGDKAQIVAGYVRDFGDAWHTVFDKVDKISGKMKGLLAVITGPVGQVEAVSGKVRGLIDAISKGADRINPFVDALKAMKEKIQDIGRLLKPVVDKMNEYNVVGLILAGTITGILGGALIALAGWLLPFIAIAAGVVAATLAVSAAWDAWGKDISGAVGNALQWLATTVLPDLQKAIEGIGKWVSDHKDEILKFFGHFGDVGKIAFDTIVTAVQIAEPLLKHIAEVALPAIGTAADVMLAAVNTAFDTIGGVWKWLGDRANDLGLKWDDLKGTIKGLTPVIDAFILLITGALFLAFVGWIAQMTAANVMMAVTLTKTIVEFSLGPLVALAAAAWAAAAGFAGLNLAALPWIGLAVLVGGAVVLIMGKLGDLGDWLGTFKTTWSDFWNSLDGVARTIGGAIGAVIQAIIDAVKTAVDWINTLLGRAAKIPGAGTLPAGYQVPAGYRGPAPPPPPAPTYTPYSPYGSKLSAFPTFATGTPSAAGGWAMVGERGPELVNLPRGSGVSTAAETAGILGGAGRGGVTIQRLEINGVGSDVSQGAARRFAQKVLDEVAVGIQEQASRFGSRPRVAG